MINLRCGDCIDVLAELGDDSIDAIVTDPPYGLTFMGKAWDKAVPSVDVWRECLRVLKPGGHLLSFAGTRTQHRMAVNIEDAGFEIRDMIAWVYGSGFPKSHDVSKAIDKAAGVERVPTGRTKAGHEGFANRGNMSSVQSLKGTMGGEGGFARPWMDDPAKVEAYHQETAPGSPEAAQWDGWGTALKPALEPITVARKPFRGTVAANVLAHGTGALNVDGCRVVGKKGVPASLSNAGQHGWTTGGDMVSKNEQNGRWPANLIHDGSDEVVGLFPVSKDGVAVKRNKKGQPFKPSTVGFIGKYADDAQDMSYGGGGSAARFFKCCPMDEGDAARFMYCAKASKKDRDEGCEGLNEREPTHGKGHAQGGLQVSNSKNPQRNNHPTVKPTELMRYLCRLVTPPGGVVLDPFMGSGSTGKAALLEGFDFIGIELDPEYLEIARARIETNKDLFAA